MATSKNVLEFRRKRKGLTDYRKRLRILTSKKPRFVVRKSLKNIQASVAEYANNGDMIKVGVHSNQLKKLGWKYSTSNMSAAYLVGYLLGKKAVKAGIQEAVLDTGLQKMIKKGKIFAVVAGAVEAGLKVPHGEDVLPDETRLNGSHIQSYAEAIKGDETVMKKQFGSYLKNNSAPEQITKSVDEVKSAIDKQ